MSIESPPTDAGSSNRKPLAVIPVVLTVIATVLAGLSSSEMTRSMYFRSLAAQHQSKAASQWGFFQAKKMRGTTLETANDLGMLFYVKPFDEGMALGLREALVRAKDDPALAKMPGWPPAKERLLQSLQSESTSAALRFVGTNELPEIAPKPAAESLAPLLSAIRSRAADSSMIAMVTAIPPGHVEAEITAVTSSADDFERATEPIVKAIRSLDRAVNEVDQLMSAIADPSNEIKALSGAVHGAAVSLRFSAQDFSARRYDREAKFNQQIGELFEVQVREAGFESDRHRDRSKNFFYAMLCAQAGVTIASLALARAQQSVFWLIAGSAGALAVFLGIYVYLAM